MELQILTARQSLLIGAMGLLVAGCDKEITVDLPETEAKVVVEGSIETGQPPIVFLTRTQSFFAPTSVASIAGTYISDAVVTVNDGDSTYALTRLCSDLIPDSLIDEVAAQTGVSADLLRAASICAWTFLNNELLGEEGRTYQLRVLTEGKELTSSTTIPQGVALDSTWFKLANQQPNDDSLGFIWARLSDPDTAGNAYRWWAQRINAGEDGEPKDSRFIAPVFSVFEDRYINGLAFDFAYNRGNEPYSAADDDLNEERGYFKRGDTVVVKFASIGLKEFRFFDSYYNNASSQGDVFSNPSNIRSNINGGLGVWAGYAPRFRTVVCQP
ncbi:MAG: DUF4249 domain-containing protein [Flavobacteriales bacterium]|nr:DUF4249 domain-containing protein [Flavobacteriales bacterium]